MDPLRRKRLQELRAVFEVKEEYGTTPAKEILFETIADYLNRKHGRHVVVPRERRSTGSPTKCI